MKCAVANCNSSNNSKACEISFFLFPSDALIQKQWLKFCGRGNKLNPKTSYVCMLHFCPDDIENSLQYEMGFAKKRILKRGTVPSITPSSIPNTKLYEERASRIEKRHNKKMVASILQEYNTVQLQENEANDLDEQTHLQPIAEEISVHNVQANLHTEEVENLKTELQALRNENKVLKRVIKKQCCRLRSLEKEMLAEQGIQRKVAGEMKKKIIKAGLWQSISYSITLQSPHCRNSANSPRFIKYLRKTNLHKPNLTNPK